MFLHQERPRHVELVWWGVETGVSSRRLTEAAAAAHCGRQLSVCPPVASRILPLTSGGQVWAKGHSGEFPYTPVSNQLQKKDKCVGRALNVNQHTPNNTGEWVLIGAHYRGMEALQAALRGGAQSQQLSQLGTHFSTSPWDIYCLCNTFA